MNKLDNEMKASVMCATKEQQLQIVKASIKELDGFVATKDDLELFVDLLQCLDKELVKEIIYNLCSDYRELHLRLSNVESYLDLIINSFDIPHDEEI